MSVALLRSALLDVPHGFATRAGGVSEGPFASLNLGGQVGDDPLALAENVRRFLKATGLSTLACATQIHGDAVREITAGTFEQRSQGEADALITARRDVALCIGTADCLPILIHAPDVNRVGAAHAGWRGAALCIGARTVEALAARGANPSKMRAVLGPSIRRCCYEISDALAARFEAPFGPEVVDRSRTRPHLDLALVSRKALERAGIPSSSIELLEACTHCDAARFFSHRRDQGRTGRMQSFIGLP